MIAASIAFRNLALHRAKTVLLGSIMGLGIAALFVGNSLIDTTVEGLRRVFVGGYTGDFMLAGHTVFPTTVFAETSGGEEMVPHIAESAALADFLRARRDVAGVLPLLSGRTSIGMGEQELGDLPMFGVNLEEYRAFFPDNIELVDGAWPAPGSTAWLMLPEILVSELDGQDGHPATGPGSRLVLGALGERAGTVIREVEVSGIFRFDQDNADLARVGLVDADTMRDLLGFASLRDGPVLLTESQRAFVESFDPDALFDEGGFGTGDPVPVQAAGTPGEAFVADVSRNPVPQADPVWQFLLVAMKRGRNAAPAMSAAGREASRLQVDLRVQSWVDGAGATARTAMTVRLAFDILVSIVGVVVVMVTMNALVVSIGERIPEIGTLRAIGAQKSFIRSMVLLETAFLSGLAGLAGLAAGGGVLAFLSTVGIRAPNLFFEALFGGPVLVPRVSAGAALRSFAWIAGLSLLSAWYPTIVALRVRPVAAMHTE